MNASTHHCKDPLIRIRCMQSMHDVFTYCSPVRSPFRSCFVNIRMRQTYVRFIHCTLRRAHVRLIRSILDWYLQREWKGNVRRWTTPTAVHRSAYVLVVVFDHTSVDLENEIIHSLSLRLPFQIFLSVNPMFKAPEKQYLFFFFCTIDWIRGVAFIVRVR